MKKHGPKDPVLLSSSLDVLAGIGGKRAAAFRDLGILTVEDLLRFLPRTYINRRELTPFGDLRDGMFASVLGTVKRVLTPGRDRLTIVLTDGRGELTLVWFIGRRYYSDKFVLGCRVSAWGRISVYNTVLQMAHPDVKILADGEEPEKGIFPIYVKPGELKDVCADSKVIGTAVRDALVRMREHLPESLPGTIIAKRGFPPLKEVYQRLHFPVEDSLEAVYALRDRLKYEEAFVIAFIMAGLRNKNKVSGSSFPIAGDCAATVLKNAGFAFTNAQKRVLREIEADLSAPERMNRLLQGDVGSGKTVVCAVAAARVLAIGAQVAFMAPTEILARQHFHELNRLYKGTGKRIELFVSGLSTQVRVGLDEDLAVGTHALISESTVFKDLKLVIVDEQHRFGVLQRKALSRKGALPEILVVSATPIPRTLALTLYGDLSLSIIDELPPGRIPVKTYIVTNDKRAGMYGFVRVKIGKGGKAFFILPLVEESEKLNEVRSVIETAAHLSNTVFPDILVDIMHGKMASGEKDAAMARFASGACKILVSTTVVEVGVDVPDADVMVIEHPERFGLSQLHQLRGRIGRRQRESFCFLMAGKTCAPDAYERLVKFAATNDGFVIAELDFETRGAGQLSGVQQSGLGEFRFLNLVRDGKIIIEAREDVAETLARWETLDTGEKERLYASAACFGDLGKALLETA